ncbi:MAG TPA: FdtA/QdtA family cupin domain-containing protein [Bacteriovoracaceae bacterium]|nr:FdtA/QdtA family cupin domain-containing protein [Bacteriovoracaceae bacterium]
MDLSKVRWIPLNNNVDERGVLTSIEENSDIPFSIKRIFYMHNILKDRGGHAHTDTEQLVIAMSGQFKVDLSDAKETNTFSMDNAMRGLYMPKMIFTRLYDFTPGAVCLVLASTHYDKSKSLRTWEEFKEFTRDQK